MNKRTCNTGNKRYVSLREWADYAGIGTTNAKKAAVMIGAEKRIGTRCVYDLKKLDDYFTHEDSIGLAAEK